MTLTHLRPDPTNSDLLDDLQAAIDRNPSSPLAESFRAVLCNLREGHEVLAAPDEAAVTPHQAARFLGVSRPYLYRLLDRGALPFHHVGRDRRIAWRDVIAFADAREDARRELAQTFANHERTNRALIEELSEE